MTSAPAGPPVAPPPLHLAVALDGAGWHPGAWQEADAQPQRLLTAGYWTELARQAERGLLDFLTIEDGLNLQSDDHFRSDSRTDRVRGRLDAVLIAARVAPATRHIGFVPTAITTHTEPFHLSKAIATLDYVSSGRAGIRVQVGARADTAAHFGRREIPPLQPGPGRRSGRAAAYRRPLRRGGRLRGGAAPSMGQLGRRRGDPRRGHRPLHRPGQAALHRLRRPLVLGQGTVDHSPAAAGPAGRGRARPRQRSVPADRPLCRRRVRHPARRGPRRRDRGGDPGRAGPGRPGRRRPCTSSAT